MNDFTPVGNSKLAKHLANLLAGFYTVLEKRARPGPRERIGVGEC
jgi:hypothetical protein